MKQFKTNSQTLGKIIRTLSKGYYSDFSEYNSDSTKEDDKNDHSQESEKNDHSNPNGIRNKKNKKSKS